MTELPPREERKGKFRNGIDEAMYIIVGNGWGDQNGETGDVQAPGGWAAKVSIEPNELEELYEASKDELDAAGFTAPSSLLGYWLVRADNDGFVQADEYDSPGERDADFELIEAQYQAWLGGES